MRNIQRAVGASVALACCWLGLFAAAAYGQGYAVDPVHSSVLFRVKHMNTSFAWGRFDNVAGRLNLDDKAATVEIQVKADSVDTANGKRDEHLKGPDFFSVKQFPTIAFKSKRVTRSADNKYDVEGTLTLHGVERPLSVQLEKTGSGKNGMGGPIAGFSTRFSIKRSDFGMKYGLEGVSDEVVLVVDLECAQQ